ncbi:MAG: rhomboid family intramembrane serine protease [Bacteroidaceae bacterium]|nr:rhomboid family intramembrane serine protease [Bacteroidaceae bacterium]
MNSMPPVTKHIIIINLLMYLARVVAMRYGIHFDDLLGLHFCLAPHFKLYQFFTYMFVHASVMHVFFNMFAVWMFGRIMERTMGSQRFLFYYIVCGLGAGMVQEVAQLAEYHLTGMSAYELVNTGEGVIPMTSYLNLWNTVGASGAVYGILLAFGMTYPNELMFIFPLPLPIKAKWFVIIYGALELLEALGSTSDGIAHMAHLGGMLFGWLLIVYWKHHPRRGSTFYGGGYGGFGSNGSNFFTVYEDVTNAKDRGPSLWQRIKSFLSRRKRDKMKIHLNHDKHGSDMEWNAKKQKQQEEVDRILDKVKKHGYGSLSESEKKILFDASNSDK